MEKPDGFGGCAKPILLISLCSITAGAESPSTEVGSKVKI
jgi:hypothetical protein